MKTILLTIACLSICAAVASCSGSSVKDDPHPGAQKPAPAAAPAVQPDAPPPVPEAERWRAAQPAPGPESAPVIPELHQAMLGNGVVVLVSERHDLPLVDVQVVLRAGSAAEPAGKGGLADLTYELMLEGAGKRDGVALAEALSDLGTSASVDTSSDGASFQLTVLRRNLDAAMGLLADVLQRPRLAALDFERRRKEHLANLVKQLGDPGFLLMDAARAAVYGPDHPYGRPAMGTVSSLEQLKLADVRAFYKASVGARTAAVVLSGDITPADALALARGHFQRWTGAAKPPARPPAVEPQARGRVVVVPKPGLGQTFIAVGRPIFAAGHADEWKLDVANTVLGGMFTSRLNMNLREDKGYTYGVRSSMSGKRGAGSLVAATPVQADRTGASLKEIFAEMEGLKARPITPEEFILARDGVLRALSGWFETNSSLGGVMAGLFQRELPMDRLKTLVQAYRSMKREEAQAAGEAYFTPGSMQVVLVGDPEVIKAQVAGMGLGELVQVPPAK